MSRTFTLVDSLALGDLQVFLRRAQRVEDGSVRLIAGSGVLAVYTSVLHPAGLLDESPTVLGLRTFAVSTTEAFDSVVPVRSLLARIDSRLETAAEVADATAQSIEVALPLEVNTVSWAAISPPRGGWHPLDPIPASTLHRVAREGIEEVAEALPTGAGEQIVKRVRTEVWSRTIDDRDYLPAGAAFAALSLGFLGEPDAEEQVAVFESGPWTRVTTPRGHVLIKRRAWVMAR
jgi:hypothetical protein